MGRAGSLYPQASAESFLVLSFALSLLNSHRSQQHFDLYYELFHGYSGEVLIRIIQSLPLFKVRYITRLSNVVITVRAKPT